MSVVITPVPSKAVRFALEDEHWQTCIDSWTKITGLTLRLNDADLSSAVLTTNAVTPFLLSYVRETRLESADHLSDNSRRLTAQRTLAKNVFFLITRILRHKDHPQSLMDFEFLVGFIDIFGRKNAQTVRKTIDMVIDASEEALLVDFTDAEVCAKSAAFVSLCTFSSLAGPILAKTSLARSVVAAYNGAASGRNSLRSLTFLIVTNPESSIKFLDSIASDGAADKLVQDLLAHTTVLDALQEMALSRPGLDDLVKIMVETRLSPGHVQSKDQSNTMEDEDDAAQDAAKLLSKIFQIQDLFPDLGDGFVEACLNEFGFDVETTTMKLLEDDLPPHIRQMERERKSLAVADVRQPARRDVSDIPMAPRNNIYDGDSFDRLEIGDGQVSQGRRLSNDADKLLKQSLTSEQKRKVLSLAYDPDDDELDDTYDEHEGMPAIDHQTGDELDGAVGANLPSIDDLLFMSFESSPEVFERSARKSAGRQDLRARTNLSDEQIEGWKAMLDREPSRARKLAEKHAFAGQQAEVQSSRWQATRAVPEDEVRSQRGGRGYRGSGDRGRGTGRGGAGRSGEDGDHGGHGTGQSSGQGGRSQEQIRRDRARKETRGSGRGRARGGGMRGQARPQG